MNVGRSELFFFVVVVFDVDEVDPVIVGGLEVILESGFGQIRIFELGSHSWFIPPNVCDEKSQLKLKNFTKKSIFNLNNEKNLT